jgi:hypothetical protein
LGLGAGALLGLGHGASDVASVPHERSWRQASSDRDGQET